MSDINYEMQKFALEMKEECTKRGYVASICLADGKGHGEFYHNIEDVDFSVIRFIEKKGKIAMHFKSYMKTNPKKTQMCTNALAIIGDLLGMNALTFLDCFKELSERIDIEVEKGKIIPFNK